MVTFKEDYNSWEEHQKSYSCYSPYTIARHCIYPAVMPLNPKFSLSPIPVPLAEGDAGNLQEQVDAYWEKHFAATSENRKLYGVYSLENLRWEDGKFLISAWSSDYATSRFANRPDKEELWRNLNSEQKSYLEKVLFPGVIVVPQLAGTNKYLFASRKDRRGEAIGRRDQSLETPQSLIQRNGAGDPIQETIEMLLSTEGGISKEQVTPPLLRGLQTSALYGDFTFIFTVEVDPNAEEVTVSRNLTPQQYERKWLTASTLHELPKNHINPAIYNALLLSRILTK